MSCLMTGGLVAADHEIYQAKPCAFRVFELAIKREVFGLLEAHAGERQEVETVVWEIGHLLLGPLLRIGEVGLKIIDDRRDGGATLGGHAPEVGAFQLSDPAGGD